LWEAARSPMDEHNMLHKANEISKFFASYPHDEAVAGIQNHLRMYWVPRMRRQIIDYVADGGAELHPLAVEAVKGLEMPLIRG
jgi:formate dehydrogenase subunit delta